MSAFDPALFSKPATAVALSPSATPAAPQPARDADGRFTGLGAFEAARPAPAVAFDTIDVARDRLARALDRTVSAFAAHGDVDPDLGAPVSVVRASAGSGKSREARIAIAKHADRLTGDVAFYTPTLALAEEAAEHMRALGGEAHVIRGRTAEDPDNPGAKMCGKADLAERLGALGAPVGPSLCRMEDRETGEVATCEHYDTCPYIRQFAALPPHPAQLFLSHAALDLPHPMSREVAFRVIDEAYWRTLARSSTIRVAEFVAERRVVLPKKLARRSNEMEGLAEEAAAVAQAVVDNLRAGLSVFADGASAAPFERLAEVETRDGATTIVARPDMPRADVEKLIEEAAGERRLGWRRARIWRLLAEAKRARRGRPETLRLREDPRDGEVIEFFWREDAPDDRPLLVLDADADKTITERLHRSPAITMTSTRLRPNAEVFQIDDRTMSRSALSDSRAMRDDWVAVIRREALIDAAGPKGGVLVGATRKVVKLFFEDAGCDFTGKSDAETSRIMLETPLHGARWLWFGGRALGSNAWRDCSSVVVIGREELPIEALEDQARSIFGGDVTPLTFVAPDAEGRVQMPELELPYTMADGSAWAVKARAHPDERVRALQMQSREWATLQLIERLRLAHAPYRKRVIIGCKVPIPGLSVDHLIPWQELKLTRAERALLEGVERGGLRLSHGGLSADAPETFGASTEALENDRKAGADLVKKWRKGLPGPAMGGGASFNVIMSGRSPLTAVQATVRIGASRSAVTALVFARPGETVEEAAVRAWPTLKTMECAHRRRCYADALVEIARGTVRPAGVVGDDGVGEVEDPRRT